ncbi:MAG: glycosyltransferase family 4 protein [Thermoanaerobaculia bacterium]
MKLAYLLEDSSIAGGTRVVVAHADILTELGHDVTLVSKGDPPAWRRSVAKWTRVEAMDAFDASTFDFVVGTFWTTLAAAHKVAGARAIHFCQGYEGGFTAYQSQKADIDRAYSLPLPKITVSPHLVEVCRPFSDDATYVGQIVDGEFFQPRRRESSPLRVLLVGPMQADFKGIEFGYEAVRHAAGHDLQLIRASQWEPATGEPAELAAEFHVGIDTAAMARLVGSCDLFLAPSLEEEGFGLPAAEAMASGLPGVMSSIPSFRSWDRVRDCALFAPPRDGRAMGEALVRLLSDASLRERLSRRGRQVVEQFRAEQTGRRLEQYFASRLKPRSGDRT